MPGEDTALRAFLQRLDERLRPLADAIEIQYAAATLLGEHVRASRVGYAEDLGDGETIAVVRNYVDGVPGLEGRYRYDDYGPELLRAFREGRTVVRPDIANDASLTPAEREAHAGLQIGSSVNVPLLKEGRLVAVLFLHHRGPRAWAAEELQMLDAVAERTWAAVQRARAEEAQRRSEAMYRTLFESMEEGCVVLEVVRGADGAVVDLRHVQSNPAFARVVGVAGARGQSARELLGGLGADDLARIARVADRGEPMRLEAPLAGPDRWFEIKASRIEPARDDQVAVLLHDITERRRAEHLLRVSHEQLETRVRERTRELEHAGEVRRQLHARLDSLQDDERRRIARELHDALGQQLTAVMLAVSQAGAAVDPAATRAALDRVTALMKAVDTDLDRLVFQLRPTGLEDCGLAEGVAAHAQTWSQLSGVPVDLLARGLERRRLPRAIESAVFRVVQEALTNVAKHARARQVAISIEATRGALRVTVEDDGRGFDAEGEDSPTSWGLLGMRERVEALGGRFAIESSPGQGATLLVQVPLPASGE